jgi:hypothetical protein
MENWLIQRVEVLVYHSWSELSLNNTLKLDSRVRGKDRDLHLNLLQEFKRTRGNIQSIREHAELLRSSRDDVTVNKVLLQCLTIV